MVASLGQDKIRKSSKALMGESHRAASGDAAYNIRRATPRRATENRCGSPHVTERLRNSACQDRLSGGGNPIMKTNLQLLRSRPVLRAPFLTPLATLTLRVLLLLASSTQTATATRRPAWQLVDYAQTGCVNITSPYSDRTTYYGIYLD